MPHNKSSIGHFLKFSVDFDEKEAYKLGHCHNYMCTSFSNKIIRILCLLIGYFAKLELSDDGCVDLLFQ